MATQINFSMSADVNGGNRISATAAEVGTTDIYLNTSFGASTTNQLVAAAFTVANIQGVFLVANQNLTIKTNSSGSPAQTINLIAGLPLYWEASAGYFSNPFTTNVTAFYITCTAATLLKGHIVTT